MILGTINLSYPYKEFRVGVTHSTDRKSTAIEWLILETIKKLSNNKIYENVKLNTIFSGIFKISDIDLLIKPCIKELNDISAISAYEIDDDTSLEDVSFSDIKITEIGEELQIKGLIPGIPKKNEIKFVYDVCNNTLVDKKINTSKCLGIPLAEAIEGEIPLMEIRNKLEELKRKKIGKNKSKINWLQETSNISSNGIEILDEKILWSNLEKKINVTKKGEIKVENLESDKEFVNGIILEELRKLGDEYQNVESVEFYDIDNEIRKIYFIDKLEEEIKSATSTLLRGSNIKNVKKEKTLLAIDENLVKNKDRFKNVDILLVFNSEEEKFLFEDKIRIYLPQNILDNGCAFISNKDNIFAGKIKVYNDFGLSEIKVGYSKKEEYKVNDVLVKIIDKYKSKGVELISLGIFKNQNVVLEKLNEYFNENEINDLDQKIKLLKEIKQICLNKFNKKLDISNTVNSLLKEYIYNIKSIESFENLTKEITYLKKYKDLIIIKFNFSNYVKEILAKIIYLKDYSDIIEINEYLKDEKYFKDLNIDTIYTDSIIGDLFSNIIKFDEQVDANSKIERIYNSFKRMYDELKEYFIELDLGKINSEESFVKNLIKLDSKKLNRLNDLTRAWIDKQDDLGYYVKNLDAMLKLADDFYKLNENVNVLRNALALFFREEDYKYKKVIIFDTSSLIENPEILKEVKNDVLKVVPTKVLEELDGKKNEEDLAYRVREVIRLIESEKILKKNADLSLLPKDLNKTVPDNYIIAVGLMYLAKDTIIVSEDINLRNKSKAQGLKAMNLGSLDNYLKQNNNETKNKENRKKSKKKAKNK